MMQCQKRNVLASRHATTGGSALLQASTLDPAAAEQAVQKGGTEIANADKRVLIDYRSMQKLDRDHVS